MCVCPDAFPGSGCLGKEGAGSHAGGADRSVQGWLTWAGKARLEEFAPSLWWEPHSVLQWDRPARGRRKHAQQGARSSRVEKDLLGTGFRFAKPLKENYQSKNRGERSCEWAQRATHGEGRCQPLPLFFFLQDAHLSEVNAVCFGPNSSLLATGGADRLIHLWNVVGGKVLDLPSVLPRGNDPVNTG